MKFPLRFIACFVVVIALRSYGQNGTPYYFDLNSNTAGFGGPASGSYNVSGNYWSTDNTGQTVTAALPYASQLTFGNAGSDFAGNAFTINGNYDGYWRGLAINSSSANITLNGTNNFYLSTGQTWTVASGSTFNEASTWSSRGLNFNFMALTLAGGGTINFNTAIGTNDNNTITENGSGLVVNLNSSGAGSAQGTEQQASYTLQNGTLNFHVNNAFDHMRSLDNAKFTINGGTINNTSGSTMTLDLYQGTYSVGGNFAFTGSSSMSLGNAAVTLTASPTITVGNDSLYIGGVVSGAYTISKAGNGVLRFTGTQTNTALKYIINAGTVSVADRANLSATPAGFTADWMTLNGGTLSTGQTGAYGTNRGFTLGASGGTIDVSNIDNSNTVQILGVIAGTGALVKTGVGALKITGANTYTGTTTINAGTLVIDGPAFDTAARTYTISSGATLNIDSGTTAANGTTTINGSGTLYVTGLWKNENPNTPYGSGRNITLSLVSGGLINVAPSGTMCNGGWKNITWTGNLAKLNVDGTFDLWDGNTVVVDALTGGGVVTKGDAGAAVALSVGANNGSGTFGGTINNSNPVALVKTGTGTQTLSGANTYIGGTIISNGTLLITNTSGSGTGTGTVTVNGGTFGGTGEATGAVTVNSGGTLSPGLGGPGQLKINGNLAFASGSTYKVTINGASSGQYSQVFDTGSVNLGSATLSLALGFAPNQGQTFTIIDNDGSDAITGTFNGLAEGSVVYSGAGYKIVISYVGGTGNDVVLTAVFPPGNLTYSTNPASYVTGTAITPNSPTSSGSPVVSYSVSPGLPAGLSLNTSTGVITGTPTTATAQANYTVTATNAAGSAAATLTITVTAACSMPSITTQPASQTVPQGDSGAFIVSSPNATSYQWEYSSDNNNWNWVTGGTNATISFIAGSGDFTNGVYIRCLVSNSCGPVPSSSAILTVCTPPTIIAPPSSQNDTVGQTATFTINTLNVGTFQWQTGSGSSWSTVGTNSNTYTIPSVTQGNDGNQFRCVVSNSCKTLTSAPCTLSVCTRPTVSAPSGPTSVQAGNSVSYSVIGTGSGVITYQWQDSQPGFITTWTNISLATNPTYSFSAAQGNNGTYYRCIVSNGCRSAVYSSSILLSVCTPPVVGTNPTDQSAAAGQNASFSVALSQGSGTISYQWQDSIPPSTSFANVTSGTGTIATYTFQTASGDDGKIFRCVISNGCGNAVNSAFAKLAVCTPPFVTTNLPANQNAIAGKPDTFTLAASGTPSLQFQWQDSATGSGPSWHDTVGQTNPSFILVPTSGMNGWKVRCRVSSTSACGAPTLSSAATLAVCTMPYVTGQPASLPLKQIGDAASFSVAVGSDVTSPSYQWQRDSTGKGLAWKSASGTGATTANYSFTVSASDTGAEFRCYISNGCGSVYSNIVTISGCTPPSTTNPSDTTATDGQQATFAVTASGTPTLTYQWWDSSSGGWTVVPSGGTARSLFFYGNRTHERNKIPLCGDRRVRFCRHIRRGHAQRLHATHSYSHPACFADRQGGQQRRVCGGASQRRDEPFVSMAG